MSGGAVGTSNVFACSMAAFAPSASFDDRLAALEATLCRIVRFAPLTLPAAPLFLLPILLLLLKSP
jgi:hypothetical protein